MAVHARLFPTRSSRCVGSSDWNIGTSKRAICCNAAMCAVLKAEAREESTSTTPRTEPCAWTGTTTAERRRKLFAASLTRESSSVSSQIITCPLSKHSLVRLDSGWSREPTSGASPALARQTTPQASRRAMAAPSASVSERTRSITPFKTIDRGRSLFSFISLSSSPNSISALFWALVALRTLALMLGSWALRLGIECSHSFGG